VPQSARGPLGAEAAGIPQAMWWASRTPHIGHGRGCPRPIYVRLRPAPCRDPANDFAVGTDGAKPVSGPGYAFCGFRIRSSCLAL